MIEELVKATAENDWNKVRQLLHSHWQQNCPKLFSSNPDAPWDLSYDELAINSSLFRPLAAAFVQNVETTTTSLLSLNEEAGTNPTDRRPGQICGYVFKCGEPTYSCKECATDPTCVLCRECFNNSIHKNHKYRMSTSGGAGYCDCGDKDAWREGHACSTHAVDGELADKMDALSSDKNIPPILYNRIYGLTAILLQYSTQMLCWQNEEKHPAFTKSPPDFSPAFQTVLFNDETHTYENVIRALDIAINCTHNQAMTLATIVDREGRSTVRAGNRASCERVRDEIIRRTQKDTNRVTEKTGPLVVKVYESGFICHQIHAIQIISWLNQQIEHFPILSNIIGDVLLNVEALDDELSEQENPEDLMEVCKQKLVEKFMYCDRKLWKAARSNFHQMLMKTVLMDMQQKYEFSKRFLNMYTHMYEDFCDDDHKHDVSIVSLTVQFFTIPSFARRLIGEEDAITRIIANYTRHTAKYVAPDPVTNKNRFDFTTQGFTAILKRAMHMLRDIDYLLNQVPKPNEWNPELRDGFVRGAQSFLDYLHLMQGMDPVKRQQGEHKTWEPEWETAFNIQIRQQEIISMFIAWCLSDLEVHHRMLILCLEACSNQKPSVTDPGEPGETKTIVKIANKETVVPSFDVLRGYVSIHQPIYRFLSMLQFLQKEKGASSAIESMILQKIEAMDVDLYEMALRVFVLCAQSTAGLWRRNGFSLVNQIHNYHSPLCRAEMFDRDLLLLQAGAALTEGSRFLMHLMHRYRIDKWADESFEGFTKETNVFGPKIEMEENSKFLVSLAEDFLHTLVMIVGERCIPGIGKCTREDQLQRELIQILSMGPQQFSAISKRISQDPFLDKLSLEEAVKSVADFKKPTATTPGTFHLKSSFFDQYNPFFYHYSKSDLSQAELYQEKIRPKSDRALSACPPPHLVHFEVFFEPVRHLLSCPMLIDLHRIILERTAKRSRFSSDRLLHRCLYLIGMALNEQLDNGQNFDFIQYAQKSELLSALEALNGKPEANPHNDLLLWVIQKFKEVERTSKMETTAEVKQDVEMPPEKEDADEAKKKRMAKAQAMRAAALQKMQRLQKTFIENVKKEALEKEDEGHGLAITMTSQLARRDGDEDEDLVKKISDHGFSVCIGPKKVKVEEVEPRMVKCILCQDEEILNEKARPFVCAAFVQKSHLFSQSAKARETQLDVHLVNAALSFGVDASTCSHTMHYECYHTLSESLLTRDRQRTRQQMLHNQKMLDTDSGEYLCPLCKRLSNTAMPLIPTLHSLPVNGFTSIRPSTFEEFDVWVDRVGQLVNAPLTGLKPSGKSHSRKRSHSERAINEMIHEATRDPLASGKIDSALSSSVPSVSSVNLVDNIVDPDRVPLLAELEQHRERMGQEHEARTTVEEMQAILGQGLQGNAPATSASVEDTRRGGSRDRRSDVGTFIASLPNTIFGLITRMPQAVIAKFIKKIVPIEKFEESVRAFTKFVIRARDDSRELEDQVKGVMSAIAIWKTTAHVARAMSLVLKEEGKPLFGALNSRQRDCIFALSRLSALLSYNLQPFGEVIAQMLKVFLSQSAEGLPAKYSAEGGSSSPTATSPAPHEAATPTTKFMQSQFAQFFLPSSPLGRKDAMKDFNVNILHVDMLSLALELMMCIGWTWHAGTGAEASQILGSVKQSFPLRELVPDGSLDELYVLRLAVVAHCYQIMATFDDKEVKDSNAKEPIAASGDLENKVISLWEKIHKNRPLTERKQLIQTLHDGVLSMLRPIALVYYSITLVPPPEALKDPSVEELEPLCRYLGLPTSLFELLDGSATNRLFGLWSLSLPQSSQRLELVKQPIAPRLLVDLPEDFSELINIAAKFRCPSIPLEEMAASIPTMCLVCGEVLCSQSYCCQKQIGKEAKDVIGACQYHMLYCTGQSGLFLRIRDSQIVLLTSRARGCLKAAPYVDEFGETDVGFRRGNPLHLNHEQYNKLRQIWMHQGVAEEVVNQFELDPRNLGYDFNHF
ncbi:unnamed protein product, partial [Mesorhabditis belari]|uniref:E3 ubiquitin-protein ligase n=1 Tax=Mesorhabditis belari TaxID=2138241 RepID=A0AAF3EVN5_9BILA